MTGAGVVITIVVDDRAGPGLIAEHGLSMWIETEGLRVLFDTGPGAALERNALALGIDLSTADVIILSHGHSDHAGGLPYALRQAAKADVYAHPGIARSRFRVNGGTAKPIHAPVASLEAINVLPGERLHWIQGPVMLTHEIGITGPIPRETDYEDTGGSFYLDPEGRNPDPIEDDLALWIRTNDGAIVCTGCSHAGIVNTLDHVRRLDRRTRIRAVLGGYHLLSAGLGRLERTIEAMRLFDPDMLVPGHCTGGPAVAALQRALGERVSPGAAGNRYRF
jgi:7,8-dihydropterin-6-yl-methyl-4-(beta-D-ribofuranosyl)aminobenzene 5'-phosphate synthase